MAKGRARIKSAIILSLLLIIGGFVLCSGLPAHQQIAAAAAPENPPLNYLSWQPAPPDMQLHLMAVLSLRHTGEIEKLKQELQQPGSPLFHKWLTSTEFARRFGPSAGQMDAVTNWLKTRGFGIESADLRRQQVRFSGSVAQVQQALGVKFVSDGSRYANLNDPRIPRSLAGSVLAFLGLNNLNAHKTGGAEAGPADPRFHFPGGNDHFSPRDFWTFYDESDPTKSGANGGTTAPDCIALLEYSTLPTVPSPAPTPAVPSGCSLTPAPTDTATGIVNIFTNTFCLPQAQITIIPTGSNQPGQPSDNEPNLDADWAHAIAPNTPIKMYIGTTPNSTTPALDTLVAAVTDSTGLCGVISSSVDDRGASGSNSPCPSLGLIQTYEKYETQAVIQGQTVFHSSGDFGANYVCGQPGSTSGPTTNQPSIEESFASADVTVVGGTQFNPTYDTNGQDTSVLTPGFEQVWQFATPVPTPVATPAKGASGGGISAVIPVPSWQQGIVPYGMSAPLPMRGVPDVSIAASGSLPGYWIATTQTLESACQNPPATCFINTGGTSASSPIWAAISRLIANQLNNSFLGNINPFLYQLAAQKSAALVDVSVTGSNCSVDSSGQCSSPNTYQVGPGYDLGTGLGSPDIAKIITAFGQYQPSPTATATATATTAPTAAPTTTATSAPTAAPTTTATTAPTAVPSTTATAAPTAVPTPGASAVSLPANVVAAPGATVTAGTLTITNSTNAPETISSVTVSVSQPSVFASLTLSGAGQRVTVSSPSASTTFTFSPALTVASGGSITFLLSATISSIAMLDGGTVRLAGVVALRLSSGDMALSGVLMLIGVGLIAVPISSRRRLAWALIAALAMTAGIAGCGGSSSSKPGIVATSIQAVSAVAISGPSGPVGVSGLPASLGEVSVQ
jgi:subtilase family serine protease